MADPGFTNRGAKDEAPQVPRGWSVGGGDPSALEEGSGEGASPHLQKKMFDFGS